MHARQVLKADIFNSGKLWFTSLRAIFSVASGGVIFSPQANLLASLYYKDKDRETISY